MNRIDWRNQVGSRSTRWRHDELKLEVRHSYDSATTGRAVWVAEVSRVVRVVRLSSGEVFAMFETVGRPTRHGCRERAIRAGMRAFRKAGAR